MRGKVLATKLNIRDRPSPEARSIGLLLENTVIDILGKENSWYEINHGGRHVYAASRYIQPIKLLSSIKGKVKTYKLNVRDQPGMNGSVIGQLVRDTLISISAEHDDWLEIPFNQTTGFVYGNHIKLLDAGFMAQGTISARKLNVRSKPNQSSEIVGALSYGAQITIQGTLGKWHEILFNGVTAYISTKYVAKQDSDVNVIPFSPQLEDDELVTDTNFDSIALSPNNKMDVSLGGKAKTVALTWNKYGQLLERLGEHYQIETACTIAVLSVESSGDGFRQENQNRQVIRFENHKFWKYWGKDNANLFNQYFKLNLSYKPWIGHKWRESADDDWEKFHGNQLREWQVLELAKGLDETAALLSISMGAPQIMGFHYKKLGYDTVQEMFNKFNEDIRYHFLGFFEFLSPAMLKALRNYDFEKFAGYYNGSGQKVKYGKWIKEYYDIYNRITG